MKKYNRNINELYGKLQFREVWEVHDALYDK
jgi:hypothetical protein